MAPIKTTQKAINNRPPSTRNSSGTPIGPLNGNSNPWTHQGPDEDTDDEADHPV